MRSKISQFLPFNFLRNRCDLPVIFPFYHCIEAEENAPHIRHLYPLRAVETFRQDIDFLCQHYEAISLTELLAWKEGKIQIKRPSFYLTFDDGLRQCYDIIRPILLEKGISASFFINSNFVDNKDLMYRYKVSLLIEKIKSLNKTELPFQKEILQYTHQDIALIDQYCEKYEVDIADFLQTYQPYCSTAQLQRMIEEGFHIGSHSATHPRYHLLDLTAQVRESLQASAFIAAHLYQGQTHLSTFAFPFTDDQVSRRFWEQTPYALTFGTAGLKHSPIANHLQRIAVERYAPQCPLSEIIKTNYLAYWIKKTLGKHYTTHPQ